MHQRAWTPSFQVIFLPPLWCGRSNGFRGTIEKILASGITRLAIKLERVNYIDSAGLGALIEAHRATNCELFSISADIRALEVDHIVSCDLGETNATSGHLKLSNLRPNFKRALQIARLLNIFETFSNRSCSH